MLWIIKTHVYYDLFVGILRMRLAQFYKAYGLFCGIPCVKLLIVMKVLYAFLLYLLLFRLGVLVGN